jgi:HAD superfamily hydrolase (TIGR01450 family)
MVSSLVDPHLSLRLKEADAILSDLDGCLISGDHIFADARNFIDEFRSRLWVVSNNSTDTAVSLAGRLKRLGVDLPADRIILAGEETVRRLAAERPGARVALHASPAIRALALDLGLDVAEEDIEAVVLGRDPTVGLGGLGRIIGHLQAGARLYITNLDLTHPGADGTPIPETGALLAALCACLPSVRFRSIGKPDRALLDTALKRAGTEPQSTVFIGDSLTTDAAAAARASVHFIHLVRTVAILPNGALPGHYTVSELAGAPC